MTVLDAFFEAYNNHDPDAAAALYTPDGEHIDMAQGHPKRGREAIAGGLRHFLRSFPDARWETGGERIIGADRAVARYVLTATLHRDLGSFQARGQRIELRGVQVLELDSGRIARSEDYWDGATFARQIHATNTPDPANTTEESTI
jgi:steroid delta-isomerase-like uncharacterized protein